jgi:membrane protein insertase Oxa1/YidC/SpoIIIJ
MTSWGVNLAITGITAVHLSVWSAGLFLGLVAITVIAGICQQRLVRNALPGLSGSGAVKADKLVSLLPAAFALWGLILPLAVTVYYASSSLTRLAQQWLLIKLHPF